MEENITTKNTENKKYKLVVDLLQYYNELNATIKRNYELKTFDFDILHIAAKVKAYIFENDDLRKVFNDEISNYKEKRDKNFYDDYITKQRNFETEMLYKIGKPKFAKIKNVTYFEYLVLDDEKYEADDLLETYNGLFYYEYLLNKLPEDKLHRLLDSYIFISNFTYQLSNNYNYELYEKLGSKGRIEIYPEIDFYTLFQITSKSMYDEFYFCEGILLYIATKNVLKILIDYLNRDEDIDKIIENINLKKKYPSKPIKLIYKEEDDKFIIKDKYIDFGRSIEEKDKLKVILGIIPNIKRGKINVTRINNRLKKYIGNEYENPIITRKGKFKLNENVIELNIIEYNNHK